MRERITYVAFDDTEFAEKTDCEKYENNALKNIVEFVEKISFLDSNKKEITFPMFTIEDTLINIEYAWSECHYMRIKELLSPRCIGFFYDHIGLIYPTNKTGLFKYNFNEGKWELQK